MFAHRVRETRDHLSIHSYTSVGMFRVYREITFQVIEINFLHQMRINEHWDYQY